MYLYKYCTNIVPLGNSPENNTGTGTLKHFKLVGRFCPLGQGSLCSFFIATAAAATAAVFVILRVSGDP